jgi:cytochrome c oxidase cbb3-type subunit 3
MRLALASALSLVLMGSSCRGTAGSVSRASTPKGEVLYARLCALCHGDLGQGYVVEGAPALGNQSFLAVVSDEFLFAAIARGRPGTRMSPWSVRQEGPLEDQEIHALVEFIRSWQTVPPIDVHEGTPITGSPDRGSQIFRSRCAECHGESGEGGSAPSLNRSEFLDAASDGFIRYVIVHGRPGTPMTSYGDELPSEHVDDLVAFIRSFEKRGTP